MNMLWEMNLYRNNHKWWTVWIRIQGLEGHDYLCGRRTTSRPVRLCLLDVFTNPIIFGWGFRVSKFILEATFPAKADPNLKYNIMETAVFPLWFQTPSTISTGKVLWQLHPQDKVTTLESESCLSIIYFMISLGFLAHHPNIQTQSCHIPTIGT